MALLLKQMKAKGISKTNSSNSDLDSCMVITRGKRGGGRWERVKGVNGD